MGVKLTHFSFLDPSRAMTEMAEAINANEAAINALDDGAAPDLSAYATEEYVDAAVTKVNVVPQAPVCAVTASTVQQCTAGTPIKIKFDTVEFDNTGAFDTVNNRFQPGVPGFYQVNCGCGLASGTAETFTSIYKNGVEYRRSTTGDSSNARLSTLVHLNGSTDYVEGFVNSKSNFNTVVGTVTTSFSASLIQASAA